MTLGPARGMGVVGVQGDKLGGLVNDLLGGRQVGMGVAREDVTPDSPDWEGMLHPAVTPKWGRFEVT